MLGRRTEGFGVTALMVVLLAVGPSAPTGAQAEPRKPALMIRLSPAEASLAVGESTHVLLVVQNTSLEWATSIQVAATANPLVLVTGATDLPDLAPGASRSEDLTVTRTAEGAAGSISLEVHVNYAQGADALPQVTSSTLTITAVPLPDLVTATLHGALDPVSEDRPSDMALTITNPRATPAFVTKLVITTPRSVTATATVSADGTQMALTVEPDSAGDVLQNARPLAIPPRSSVLVPLALLADGSLDPGQRTVTVQLHAVEGRLDNAAPSDGKPEQVVVASKDLKVEVFGESAILGALGVPLLLLLPGLIILTTTVVLLKAVGPWRGKLTSTTLDLSKASLAAVASVFVSLLVALAYPALTDWIPGESRNLRKGYGFADFYYVYLWSFAIAVGAWTVLCLAKPALDWSFRIDPYHDDCRAILRKLSFRYATTKARVVSIPDGSNPPKNAIQVGSVGDKWLVIPPVHARFNQDSALREVEEKLNKTRLWHAWWKLRLASRARHVSSLSYEGGTYIPGPRLLAPDVAEPTAQERTTLVAEPE